LTRSVFQFGGLQFPALAIAGHVHPAVIGTNRLARPQWRRNAEYRPQPRRGGPLRAHLCNGGVFARRRRH
jgi:hypothetical protein